MTWPSLCCVLGSVVLLLAFLGAVVFVDPAVYFGAAELDFCGLTAVFFTLDMIPLIFLLFSNDAKVSRIVFLSTSSVSSKRLAIIAIL